jgi:hypothetical protein
MNRIKPAKHWIESTRIAAKERARANYPRMQRQEQIWQQRELACEFACKTAKSFQSTTTATGTATTTKITATTKTETKT